MKERIYFNDRVNSINAGRKPSPELYIPQEREPKKLNTQSDLTLMHQINANLRNARGIQISIAGARAILDKETDSIIVICEDIYDRDNVLQYLKTIYEETLNIVKDKEDGSQLILTRKPNSYSSQLLDESLYDLRKDPNLFDKIYEVASQVREEMESKYGEDFLYGKCIEASDKIVSLLKDKNVDAHTVEGWVTYDYDECCSDRNYDEHTWVETEEDYIVDVTATQFNYFMEEDYPPIIITKKLPYGFSLQRPNNNINEDFSDKYDFARHYQKHVSQQTFDMDYKNNQMDFISPRIYEDRAIELMNSKAGLSNSNEDEVIGFMVSEDRALKYNRRYNTIVIYNINTNDIVTYYKTNYKKYLFKLERDYKGELPENKNEIINADNDNVEDAILEENLTDKIKYKSISNIDKFKKYANEILGGYGGMSDSDIKRDIEEIYIDGELKGYIGLSKYNEEDGTKLLGIGNFMIIERGKGYGTQVINDIVSKYKSNYDLIYCFVDSDNEGAISLYKKLGKVYDEDGPNDNNQYYVTFYDNGKYKLEESIKKNTLTTQQQKIIEKIFSDPILSELANENKWLELLQHISYEEAKDLEIINKKVNLAIPETFSKDHPTYKEYIKSLEMAKKSPNYEENMILIKAFQSPTYTSAELTNILNKYNIRITNYGVIRFNCPNNEVSKTNSCFSLEIGFDRGADLLTKSKNLKIDWIDKIKKKIPRNMLSQYQGDDDKRKIGLGPRFHTIDIRNLDRYSLADFYPGKNIDTLTRQELERFVDAAVIRRQAAQASEKKQLAQQIKQEDESAVKYRAEKDYYSYGRSLADKARAEDRLSSLKIPEKGYYKEELEEAKKPKKKRKSQTQNNPVFKDINDLLRWTKKRQKGLPYFGGWLNPNAGNVEYNNDMFNHLTGADGGDFGSISGSGNELGAPAIGSDMGSFGGDAGISAGGGMGESFNMEEKVKNNSTQEEMPPNVKLFIEENIDLIEDENWDELFELAQNNPKYPLHLNDKEIDELIYILVNTLGANFEIIE